jgi:uncharacterized membrane protein YfcA
MLPGMPETFVLEWLLTALLGGVVGVALGLTGGGGSIFAVPLLIYGAKIAPASAVTISLVGVAMTALVGALQSIRHQLVVWQPSGFFGLGGVVGAPVGAIVAHRLPGDWLVSGFAVLALVVGISMLCSARFHPDYANAVRAQAYGTDAGPICVLAPDGQLRFSSACALVLAVMGLGTGFLSGLFGVGGGFLIVPALVLVTRMGVHRAVATSLLVISAVGTAGAAGAVAQGAMPWSVLVPFAIGGAAAMLTTRTFARRVAGATLQRGFAACVIATGIFMLAERLL